MKKIYLFLLFFLLIGCGSNQGTKIKSSEILCPNIFFSSEHKRFVDSNAEVINTNNISYKAEINNAIFSNKCQKINNFFSFDISILFVVTPIEENQQRIDLPFYIAALNNNNDLLDIQYFKTEGIFEKNIESNLNKETELKKKIKFRFDSKEEVYSIVIGFMLNKQKMDLLY